MRGQLATTSDEATEATLGQDHAAHSPQVGLSEAPTHSEGTHWPTVGQYVVADTLPMLRLKSPFRRR